MKQKNNPKTSVSGSEQAPMTVAHQKSTTTTASGTKSDVVGVTSNEAIKALQLSLEDKEELKKFKICLVYGDWNASTGFGMVLKKLMEEWIKKEDYLFFILGINDHSSNEYDFHDRIYVFPALPNKDNDVFGRLKFLNKLYMLDVDTVFLLNDPEILNGLGDEMHKINRQKKKNGRKTFKSIAYFPIDSTVRTQDVSQIGRFDEIVTYTKYAKENVESMLPSKVNKEVSVIPHGIDKNDFFEVESNIRSKIRKKLFGKNHESKFIVGSVNRNQVRKDVGGLLNAFCLFQKNVPHAVLYLHMNPKDPVGLNISRACNRLGLDHGVDVITPKDFNENKGFSIKDLNLIYNSFDVFVSTTTAEGWGLTIAEAMATKTPVVCPLHTAIPEVTGVDNVFWYDWAFPMFFVGDYEKTRFVSDPFDVKEKIQEVYDLSMGNSKDRQLLQKKCHEAMKLSISRDWSNIANSFYKLF